MGQQGKYGSDKRVIARLPWEGEKLFVKEYFVEIVKKNKKKS